MPIRVSLFTEKALTFSVDFSRPTLTLFRPRFSEMTDKDNDQDMSRHLPAWSTGRGWRNLDELAIDMANESGDERHEILETNMTASYETDKQLETWIKAQRQ